MIPSVAAPPASAPPATPAAPTNVSTANLGPLRRTTWTDNAVNELVYHVQRRSRVAGTSTWGAWVTLNAGLAPNSTQFDDGTGSAGNEYQYQVRAENGAGASAWGVGNTVCVSVAPSFPTGLSVTPVTGSDSQLDLAWTAPSGTVQSYGIWREGVLVATVPTTTFRDSGLLAGTQYCYEVDARNGCGEVSARSSQACAFTNVVPPAESPTVTGVVPISSHQLRVTWTAVARATSYEIELDTDPLFGSPDVLDVSAADLTEDVGGLLSQTQYYARVRGKNAAGVGPWSTNVVAGTTWPALPQNLQVSQNLGACPSREYQLTWSVGTRTAESVVVERRNITTWEPLVGSPFAGGTTGVYDAGASMATNRYRVRFITEVGAAEAAASDNCPL